MILRDRRSTSYDLASLFRGGRNTSDRWSGKLLNVLVRGCQLCTQSGVGNCPILGILDITL